jgi:hypothetical protein
VVVVVHQTIGVADNMILADHIIQQVEKHEPVAWIQENALLLVAAGRNVVEAAREFDSKRTRHACMITAIQAIIKSFVGKTKSPGITRAFARGRGQSASFKT